MPLTGSTLNSILQAKMVAAGHAGASLPGFCNAVAQGTVLSLLGKPFSTIDSGLIPGSGSGVGIGIIGVNPAIIMSTVISVGLGMGLAGTSLPAIADAVGSALVAELALATLSSVNLPVFLGVGNIVPGSILAIPAEWAANIQQLGVASGFAGASWPMVCQAIAQGCFAGLATATGIVTIAGAFAGPVPPGPLPGAGSGTGTIA
jgi:hypothetical protein